MQVILDQPIVEQDRSSVKYGGFWPRLGALLLDGLILSPLTFGVTFFNITEWKSTALMVVVTLAGIAYKPFMEYSYGATLGKMALRLKVVDLNFGRADIGKILLRNVFNIVPAVLTLLLSIGMYMDPGFEDITGFMEYSAFSQQFSAIQYVSYCNSLIAIVEAIMLAVDDQKRALHDRIAGTYVIEGR